MANKRVITSDMFSDDKFMFFDDFTRILWVGLITVCADDQGRFQNNEALIKSQVFPADKKSSSRVHKSLKELEEKGMVFFYEKDGKKLAQKSESIQAKKTELEAEIKAEVLEAGRSVKGTYHSFVWSKPRVSWDTKALDGYALAHPEIAQFRTEGSPSVSVRKA